MDLLNLFYWLAYIEHQLLGLLSDAEVEVLSVLEVIVIYQQQLLPWIFLQTQKGEDTDIDACIAQIITQSNFMMALWQATMLLVRIK